MLTLSFQDIFRLPINEICHEEKDYGVKSYGAGSHTLSPSAKDFPTRLIEKIQSLTRLEQQRFFSSLNPLNT